MNLGAVNNTDPTVLNLSPDAPVAPSIVAPVDFSDMLHEAIERIDGLQQEAHQTIAKSIEGDSADVHEAVIAVEKAQLSFELAVQVRNKVVQAYQEVSRMQF